MDSKYNIPKKQKPETRAEILAEQIEELVKERDKTTDPSVKQDLQARILKLYAQYERAKI